MAAGLGQPANSVHRRCPKPNHSVASADQGEGLLLLDGPVCNGPKNLRIQPGVPGQLLGIYLIAFAVAMRDGPQLADFRHDQFMAKFLKLLADPDRVRPRLHRHPSRGHNRKPSINALRRRSETTAIDHFAVFVESAVMAPNIHEVDADRHGNPGLSAWNVRDEVR